MVKPLKSTAAGWPEMISAITRPEPQASVQPKLPCPVSRNKFPSGVAPMIGAQSGVMGRNPVHNSALCKELDIETSAEFVENDAATRLMRAAGVDHGRGWHFGKPDPELPWEHEADKAAAGPNSHENWDPTVGRCTNA